MHRTLPLLLATALVGSGCAMAARPPRSSRSYRGGYADRSESVQAHVTVPTLTSTGSSSRYRSRHRPRYHRVARRMREASPASMPSASRPPAPGPGGHARKLRALPRPRGRAQPIKAQPANATAPASGPSQATARGAQVPQTRLVIYHGTLVLRVFKLADAEDLAQKLALETGAYIQTRYNTRMVIRVPVGRFHELMARLAAVGEVAGKSIAAQDVTQQYFDVTHRLKAAHAVLARLKSLLLKARNVNESLEIEREMSRLLTRIERFKGLLRYLRHHASLSTITVYFRVKPRHSRPIQTNWRSPFGWVKGLGLWRMMQF